MVSIHPTAMVDEGVTLPDGSEIGPYARIEVGAQLLGPIRMGAFSQVNAGVTLGAGVQLDVGVVLGGAPQDLKYNGEMTPVQVGPGTRLREYVTVNRATTALGCTRIGADCLIMAYTHIAHDCVIEDKVVIANAVQMGGHVHVGKAAVLSGLTGLHQFVTVGAGAFVGGGLRLDKDVPPGIKALGEPIRWGGLNPMGWDRLGIAKEQLGVVENFYRQLKRVGASQWESLLQELPANSNPLRQIWVDFFKHQSRGIILRDL